MEIFTREQVKRAANKFFGHDEAIPVFEHGQWWVKWYDFDEEKYLIYGVEEAEGPGTVDGIFFEEC